MWLNQGITSVLGKSQNAGSLTGSLIPHHMLNMISMRSRRHCAALMRSDDDRSTMRGCADVVVQFGGIYVVEWQKTLFL